MRRVKQNWLNPGQNTTVESINTRPKIKSFKLGKGETISGARKSWIKENVSYTGVKIFQHRKNPRI